MNQRILLLIPLLLACRTPQPEGTDALLADAAETAGTNADLLHVQAALLEKPSEIQRFIVHLHGPFSKDACDGNGLPDGKTPNAQCLADLRAGLCASGLSVAFLTDHPTHMKDFPFEQLLYFDQKAGDVLVKDEQDQPFANVMQCAQTALQPAHQVTLLVGFEGDHTMPVGLHHHLTNPDLYKVSLLVDTPLPDIATVTTQVHERGGLMVLAHAETEFVTPQRVLDAVDVVELYNIHANVTLSYFADPTRLFEMDPWLQPKEVAAHPDLAIVPVLSTPPEAAMALWHAVLQQRKTASALGSDAHENVQFPQLCQGGLLDDICEQHKLDAPSAYAAFSKPGQITLADGVRFDNYTRMLRWYSSRARLQPSPKPLHERVQTALATGETHHVWNVFGEPDRVELTVVSQTAGGWNAGQIGDSLQQKPGMLLALVWPHVQAEPWSPFTSQDADLAPRELRVWQVTAQGAQVIATWTQQGTTGSLQTDGDLAWLPLPGPGRYHLEVQIQPTHLAKPLKNAKDFAQKWYRWLVTDVVEVTP